MELVKRVGELDQVVGHVDRASSAGPPYGRKRFGSGLDCDDNVLSKSGTRGVGRGVGDGSYHRPPVVHRLL